MKYLKFVDGILEKLKNIKSNFFTVDIAKKSSGEWIVMSSGMDRVSDYKKVIVKIFIAI